MLTKPDFQKTIEDSIANYPALAPLYRTGDPRILQGLDAMAAMLAMFSSQLETAMAEPFEKTRDSTVLADAAMRGVIRKANPARVRVLASNDNSTPFSVDTGRVITDSGGLPYIIETAAVIPANGSGSFDAVQVKKETLSHTVSGSVPFYAIEIPASSDDTYLSGVSVSDADGSFEYRERYVNTFPGERIYHIEADDTQRVYVRFGQADVVGVQPVDGQVITLTISRTAGDVSPASGSPFSFEYLQSPQESAVALSMEALLEKGANPPDMATMRDLVKYPSVYNHSAVFLGEFDFVVRRKYSDTQFLSIWNESIEETARGPSVDHINTLFVACLSAEGSESVLIEPDPYSPVAPNFIEESSLTETQQGMRDLILNADNSYRVKFVTPVRSEIVISIDVKISTAYVAGDVQSKIIETILAEYGESQPGTRRSTKPLYKKVYHLLKTNVPALADANADIKVDIADTVGNYRPELWRYVSPVSLTVIVSSENVLPPSTWGT